MIGFIIYAIIGLCLGLGGLVLRKGWGGPRVYDGSGRWGCDPPEQLFWLTVGWAIVIPSLIMLITVSVLWPVNYFSSLNAVQGMRAFRNSQPAYVAAIAAAEEVQIKGAKAGIVDLAYQQQALAYTDLVSQYRDNIRWYNETLQQTEALNDNPFVGWMRVGTGDLEPITGDLER